MNNKLFNEELKSFDPEKEENGFVASGTDKADRFRKKVNENESGETGNSPGGPDKNSSGRSVNPDSKNEASMRPETGNDSGNPDASGTQRDSDQSTHARSQKSGDQTLTDKFLKLSADFENFKKRVERERMEWAVEAQAELAKKFLQVIEDFDRAVEYGKSLLDSVREKSKTVSDRENDVEKIRAWFDGLLLVKKSLHSVMKEVSLEEIDCSGSFNPALHEAMMQVDSAGKMCGEIVNVISKGYKFKGKVLRHAKVSVAK